MSTETLPPFPPLPPYERSKVKMFLIGVNESRLRRRRFPLDNPDNPEVVSALVGLYFRRVIELPEGEERTRGERMAMYLVGSLCIKGQYRLEACDEDTENSVPLKKGNVDVMAVREEITKVVCCEVALLRDVPDMMTVTVSSPGQDSLRVFDIHDVCPENRDAFLLQVEMDGAEGQWESIMQVAKDKFNFPEETDAALTDWRNQLLIQALTTMKREVDVKSTPRRPNWLDLIDTLEGSKDLDEGVIQEASALTVLAASRWLKSPR